MSKAFRVMLWPVMQLAAVLLAFCAIILAGLRLFPSTSNLFTMYYRMFPMLVVIIASMSSTSLWPYLNLALSMNGKRPHLFTALQAYLVLLSLFTLLCTKGLWLLGSVLYQPFDLPLSMFALMAGFSLLLGELMTLVTGMEGKVRTALYTVMIVVLVLFCGGMGAYTASQDDMESGALTLVIPDQWLFGGALVLIAVSAILAGLAWRKLRKAAVEV